MSVDEKSTEYRQRADEIRSRAALMSHLEARGHLLTLALEYEVLAAAVERLSGAAESFEGAITRYKP